MLCVACGAGVCLEHSIGAAVLPAPRSAGPVHGEVLHKTSGVPVSEGLVGMWDWDGGVLWYEAPAGCGMFIGV